jgi:hypothetical protein
LRKLEIWLSILVPILVMLVFAGWAEMQTPDRRILSDGTVELRENAFTMITAIVLILVMVVFGFAVLWRRRWRRLAVAGILSLFMGVVLGIMLSRMAISGVMMFTQTGVTISEPSWQGGQARARLVYSQIDWLGWARASAFAGNETGAQETTS